MKQLACFHLFLSKLQPPRLVGVTSLTKLKNTAVSNRIDTSFTSHMGSNVTNRNITQRTEELETHCISV